jgi:tetratricopeptide (TPR) repeat protein
MHAQIQAGNRGGDRPDLTQPLRSGRSPLGELLLRPFIDLQPCERGPLCARGMEQYWIAFAETQRPKFALQRSLPQRFRSQFLSEAGLSEYQGEDPRDVAPTIRSARWSAVCEALDHWRELTTDQQCRLVSVLRALCFYQRVADFVPRATEQEIAADSDADRAELVYWGASARYMLGFSGRVGGYHDADLSEMEMLATALPFDQPVAFSAALKLLVHKAKIGAPKEEVVHWRARAERSLKAMAPRYTDFRRALLLSCFYRAAAFDPQHRGDRGEVVHMMDLAEHYAVTAIPTGPAEQLLSEENLYPIIESRTKEALWLGDLDLALSRAKRLIDHDPFDPRAWLELGQVRLKRHESAPAAEAYAVAAMLGPPASTIGCHMAGLCFRDLGQPLLAAFFFKAALDIDPRGISPHNEIQHLPKIPVLALLKDWSLGSFEP